MWVQIALFVASLVISYLTRPKTRSSSMKPGTLDVGATAEAGKDIPVVFGTVDISGQNIIWYGDIKTKAIKKSGGKK